MDDRISPNNLVNNDGIKPVSSKPSKVVELATIGGAKALGLDKKVGSLEEGKYPDIMNKRRNVR